VDAVEAFATIAEVAREFRVSDEHVRRMCSDGRLPAVRFGAVWRIPTGELRAFVAKSRKGADAADRAAGSIEDLGTDAA
jgi:excisionase family DNA binding protein